MDDFNYSKRFFLIILLICYLTNLILSAFQLSNKGGYGYDGILSMLKSYPTLLEIRKKECNKYISDIEYKKDFAKKKSLFVLLYNSGLIIYNSIRLKPVDKKCLIDIFFNIIIFIGYICELVLVSMSLNYYNKTEYDSEIFEKCNLLNDNVVISEEIFDEANTVSKWVIKIDKGIISIICIYLLALIVNACFFLDVDWDKDDCINDEICCWVCYCLCCSDGCKSISNCCSRCCDECGNCCAKCCGNDYTSLKETNDNLRKKVKELAEENQILKKENNKKGNNILTERDNLQEEITIIKDKNERELPIIKKENINLINEINNLRHKFINLNIKEKQMEVIEFYLRKNKANDFNNNYKSSLKIMIFKEIYKKYGLYLDSNKFIKIALYYIESKLNEHLTDSIELKLFSNPYISKEGKTFEGENHIISNDFVENKLVAKICKILNNNKDNLKIEDFNIIKQLLKDEKTGNYYINPIVIPNGINKGETIEGNNVDQDYKNIVIKNIIIDMK